MRRIEIGRRMVEILLLSALFLVPQSALAQEEDEELRKQPGYVDFDEWIGRHVAESTVEIFIKDPILSLVARLSKNGDSELSNVLSALKLIRVQSYPLEESSTRELKSRIEKIRKKLEADQWEIVVRAREPDEEMHVYIKSSGDRIDGLVILSAEYEEEVSFVNIVGDIDLTSIAKVGERFDIPGLDSLKTQPDTE